MIVWLTANLASVLVGFALLTCVTLVIWKMIRDHRAGKHLCGSCGGNCGSCAGCGGCCTSRRQPLQK